MNQMRERMNQALILAEDMADRHKISLSLVIEDLQGAERVSLKEDLVHSSASTIKIPLMLAVMEEEGRAFSFSDVIELKEEQAVDFSVVTQIGERRYSVLEYLQWMMLESCNASTNVLIDLVGYNRVNRIFDDLEMKETRLRRKMMDMEARKKGVDNTTSARDMATLLQKMYKKEYFSASTCSKGLSLMKRCRDKKLLKRFIPQELSFAHKSGGLDEVSHDAGIFFGENDLLVCAFATSKKGTRNTLLREQTIGHIGRCLFKERRV